MPANTQRPTAKTAAGAVEGQWEGDVASFLGIPYAQPPIGPLRWAPPLATPSWDGTRPAHRGGPVAPQPPARLEAAMGPMDAPPPGEDCLSLNVWTPAPSSQERLPVMVFLHGGGYLSGAGSAAWYEGATMARRGGAVVVTLNYRLGALGYLYLPASITGGAPVANLGLQDQRLALEWVQANAAAFGGDPGSVTVFGQSGGGHSILGLKGLSGSDGLFQRAILQSAPLGMPAASAAAAERVTGVFLDAAGIPDARLDDLRRLSVRAILEAQRATLMTTAVPGRIEPPFQLVVDGETLTEDPIATGLGGSLDGLDLLVGFTTDEARAFFAFDDALWELDIPTLVEEVRTRQGEFGSSKLQRYIERSPSEPAAAALSHLVGDELIVAPSMRLAEGRAQREASAHVFRFSWSSDALGGRLGSCHTIELPFVFNNFDAWGKAPMLGGSGAGPLQELGDALQDAWLAFAANGSPQHGGLPDWPGFSGTDPRAMDFGGHIETVSDPTGGRRTLWEDPPPAWATATARQS